jgi:hypothetical protein
LDRGKRVDAGVSSCKLRSDDCKVKYLFFPKPLEKANASVRNEILQYAKDIGFFEVSQERVLRSNKNCSHSYSSPCNQVRLMDIKSPYSISKYVEDRFENFTTSITQLYQGKKLVECDSSVKDAFRRLNIFASGQILGAAGLGRFKNKLRKADFCLEFIQFIILEPGNCFGKHRDGSVYGDLVAVFCIHGFSVNSIDDVCFELKQGEMYIFDSSQLHSVDCSLCKEPRFAVSLRHYVNPEIEASL